MLDKKIIQEIQRYHNINNYITEQDAPIGADLGALAPPAGGVAAPPAPSDVTAPPAPTDSVSEPIDVEMDDEVTKIDNKGKSEEDKDSESESGIEELEITDLVDSQKNIEKKQEEYFNNLFQQISNLENKLNDMESVMSKLDNLESKIEKYREKTPEEKLQLRSYDSYPFNQKLSDFFDDKKEELEITGKNDYVLTSDDVTDINPNDIKNSFNGDIEIEEEKTYRPKFGETFNNRNFR